MSLLQYSIVANGDEKVITVFLPGGVPLVAHSDHPNFEAIVEAALDGEPNREYFEELFDVSVAVAKRFDRLSERVTAAHGRLYFDGDEVNNALASQVLRFLDEGVEDWQPLVAFFENVQANPNDHSREQLFDWLNARDFTITSEGYIVGYKGVRKNGDGSLVSGFTGTATVNGEAVSGHIPNEVGSLVEMPRTAVAHNPSAACSTGLHVGTYDYARMYASGAMLRVAVNPRDVVSVPTDAAGEKVRVCRYTVEEVIEAPVQSAILWDEDECDEDNPYDAGDDRYDDEDCHYEDDFFLD